MEPTIVAAIITAVAAIVAAYIGSRGPQTPKAKSLNTADLEVAIRADEQVLRLLLNPNWKPTAEAAIAYLLRNIPSPVDDWPSTATWQQVVAVHAKKARSIP